MSQRSVLWRCVEQPDVVAGGVCAEFEETLDCWGYGEASQYL